MATASELDKIRINPIKNLDSFRRTFESTRSNLNIALSSNTVQLVFSKATTTVIQDLLVDLFIVLQAQPTARALPSRNNKKNLRSDLFDLTNNFDSDKLDIKLAIPLVELVVNDASDVEIWDVVFHLISSLKQSTPPTSSQKDNFDTPLRSNSASQIKADEIHRQVDLRILEEIWGRVYDDVEGFYERYFYKKKWSNKAKNIYKKSRAQYIQGRWSGWPEPSDQEPFLDWFMKFQNTFLNGLGRRYYTLANKILKGSEADRKLDIFLASTDVALLDNEYDWSNVLVIGEHKSNPAEDKHTPTLIQLAGYAREVFGSQPGRRFVPGFTICGSLMRLWIFDRSGLYSSEKFDIHKEPERFVEVIAGYALMTDTELGLNTFIKRDDNNGKYIVAQNQRIFLEDKPIAFTKAIVCRGTACFRGRRSDSIEWEYVVKFAWPSDKRQEEGELLKLAKERGVTGIAIWFSHEPIKIDGNLDTITYLRRDMIFGEPRKLSSKASWVGHTLSLAFSKIGLRGNITTSNTMISSSRLKEERDNRHDSMTNMHTKEVELDSSHSIQPAVTDSLADCRNKWQQITTRTARIQEPRADNPTDDEIEKYDNRVSYCLVTSPAGRPLHKYQSVRELLEALRDAIQGHRSLFEVGKILHRDISENNIIITEHSAEEDLKGRLIDLDLAKKLDGISSGAHHRTGTMQFMAIGVLEGQGHTYRHDLESFFYVFLWICIRYSSKSTSRQNVNKPITKTLQDWYTGSYLDIARRKRGDMFSEPFEYYILSQFGPNFENLKPLAHELRSALFPMTTRGIFTGTYDNHNIMYDNVIAVFNRAIDGLGVDE